MKSNLHFSAGPTIQPNSGAYSSGGTNIIKQDPNSGSTNVSIIIFLHVVCLLLIT